MNNHNHPIQSEVMNIHPVDGLLPQILLALPFLLGLIAYIMAANYSSRRVKQWPLHRTICWSLGVILAITAVAGPLATLSHTDFTAHMIGHLLLGMLAPLLMAVSAPMTLFLRTSSVPVARKISKILRSRPIRFYTNPFFTSFLNIGGLWVLYTTNLYSFMHEYLLLFVIVHLHVFLAGYLFTISIIYFDPISHRVPFVERALALVISLAWHGILSKFIYANPPVGVAPKQAEIGSMVMYYGGDIIDIVIIFILCLHWYRATRPRKGLAIR